MYDTIGLWDKIWTFRSACCGVLAGSSGPAFAYREVFFGVGDGAPSGEVCAAGGGGRSGDVCALGAALSIPLDQNVAGGVIGVGVRELLGDGSFGLSCVSRTGDVFSPF